ncbi:type II secretion system F family protein [Curtobacterium sp. YC1]|nr:type II secretion system F family protein [Curtobacterium sp. YC1]
MRASRASGAPRAPRAPVAPRAAAAGRRPRSAASGPSGPSGASVVAGALDRVATLVAAGVPPPRAWQLVGGLPTHGGPAERDIAVVLRVADRTGAPVADTLRALAGALRRTAASDRAVRVALAGPRTSARVVLALPLFGLGLGAAWGAGAIEVLVGSPAGWACTALAAVLVTVGRSWTARLVRSATPDGHVPGVLLDAWAVAVAGGGSWTTAGAAVAEASGGAAPPPGEAARLHDVLDLARRAGVPAAGLLRRAAEDVRDEAAADGLAAAERLAVRLVLPLGVCVLPAFVLVGVVPVVVGVLSSTTVGTG